MSSRVGSAIGDSLTVDRLASTLDDIATMSSL